jgi:soluble lytic murein transglycosylase
MRHLTAIVCLAACSGDDSHKQSTMHAKPAPAPADAAPVTPPTDAAPPAATGQLTEAMAMPYFASGDAAEGAKQFALENWKDALAAFTKARAAEKDPMMAGRLDLVIGLVDEHLDDWPAAADHHVAAHKQLTLLPDYTGFHAARALYRAHRFPEAMDLAKTVSRDSIVGADDEILIGDLLAANNDWPGVLAHYRDYLQRHPDGPHRSEARFRIAEALEHGNGDKAEIVKVYRQITIDDPLSTWNGKAHDRLTALAPTLPKPLAKTIDTFTAAEHITRGMVLYDNMRNPESEAAFDAALADPKISKADKCKAAYHRADSRFKARDRKGAAPMFDDAVAACKAAGDKNLEIKSNYQAGRSYSFFGEHHKAVDRYKQVQVIDPKHSYADDGLLREAEEWAVLGDGAKVEAALSSLPTKFPAADNIAEAMWRLGWRAWRDKKYDDAIKWWNKQIELVPRDDSYFGEGEPQYWLGRAYAAKGQAADAIAWWEKCVRTYPAAYYALQSLNRLREADKKAYDKLVAEISADPAGFDAKSPAFSFSTRPEWSAPGFLRAIELLRLGIGEPAAAELRKMGLNAPGDRKRVDDPDKVEKLWAMAFLYDRAGRHATSIWPTRWHILDYRQQWPVGANRARWLIAYPKAYWELLNRHANMNHVPIAMQIAIVREESGFDPLDESYANAIGLTQMIPVTAKDFSRGTGIDPTRENLRDPEKNVTIGGRFLGSLYKKWNGYTLLVPPSYNAGPAGVTRMLKARGTWDADEFVEGIVDDQARNYTKRVLGSYFTYSWLYEHAVPELPLKIPAELLPKK